MNTIMVEQPCLSRLLSWTACRSPDRRTTRRRAEQLVRRVCPDLPRIQILKVAGTNGKGSVCGMLDACLRAGGRSVGLFTSPHLERMTERMHINGREITPRRLESVARRIESILDDCAERNGPTFVPSFFEVLLLIALRAFLDEPVDVAVIEAGIGGRHDATAVLPAAVSAVTTVGLDHTDKLGASLDQIAAEKAGIACDGSTLVIGPQVDAGLQDGMERALADRQVRVIRARSEASKAARTADESERIPAFQRDNIAAARAIVDAFGRRTSQSFPPVGYAAIPGRFEHIAGAPSWLLDGAHNEEGIAALIDGIDARFPATDRLLIFGTSNEQAFTRYSARLPAIATRIWVTDDFHRAVGHETVATALRARTRRRSRHLNLRDAIRAARRDRISPDGLVVVAGSMFLVGKIRSLLRVIDA